MPLTRPARLYSGAEGGLDADVLLTPDGPPPAVIAAAVRSLTEGGKSVIVRGRSDGVRGRETLRVDAKGGLNRD